MPNDTVVGAGNNAETNAERDTNARRPVAALACAIALKLIAFGLIAFAATDAARADTYPSRNIELIVPLAAGSTTDVAARVLSDQVSKTIGQAVIVENKPGAGIMVGSSYVAKAAPDGYTILMGTTGLSVDPLLKTVPFNAEKDFIPVAMLVTTPMVMDVNPKLGVKTLKDYLTKFKDTKTLTFASGGTGTYPHLTGEIFAYKSGIPLRHIPYRGGNPAFNDVIAGHVDMMFGTPVTKPHIDNGEVVALAVGAPERVPTLPEVPTFKEAGLDIPEIEAGAWFGLFVPKGTPHDIVSKIHKAYSDALNDPTVRGRLLPLGLVPKPMTQADFQTFFHKDVARWPDIFKKAHLATQGGK